MRERREGGREEIGGERGRYRKGEREGGRREREGGMKRERGREGEYMQMVWCQE